MSWFITGEQEVQDLARRLRPREAKEPLLHQGWRLGAWELAARYSYLDLNDKGLRGGIENNTTVGVNWYLYSNLRLMLNWVHAHQNGLGDADIIQTRFAVDF